MKLMLYSSRNQITTKFIITQYQTHMIPFTEEIHKCEPCDTSYEPKEELDKHKTEEHQDK